MRYKPERVALVWSGHIDGTSCNLFRELDKKFSRYIETRISCNTITKSGFLRKIIQNITDNIKHFQNVLWTDIFIVHSYACLVSPSILLARALRKKVVIFHWDAYPTTMRGRPINSRLRRLIDAVEKHVVKLATSVVIPSSDFRGYVSHRHIIEIPIWPSITPLPFNDNQQVGSKLRVAFVGQLHPTRGLVEFIKFAKEHIATPFELHLFTGGAELGDDVVQMAKPVVTVVHHPHMGRDDLQERLSSMDLGLVSLSPDLDQPGFPSKTFDYVAANTPILYFGRPLPSYCKLLTETGVGEIIQEGDCSLTDKRARLIKYWPESRDRFYEFTNFDAEQFLSKVWGK